MAPELFNINNEGKSGLPTCESDSFALGMVTFEARNVCREDYFMILKLLLCFPSGIHRTSAVCRG
jgi:hypothetical protein